jgi:hypothetical protein
MRMWTHSSLSWRVIGLRNEAIVMKTYSKLKFRFRWTVGFRMTSTPTFFKSKGFWAQYHQLQNTPPETAPSSTKERRREDFLHCKTYTRIWRFKSHVILMLIFHGSIYIRLIYSFNSLSHKYPCCFSTISNTNYYYYCYYYYSFHLWIRIVTEMIMRELVTLYKDGAGFFFCMIFILSYSKITSSRLLQRRCSPYRALASSFWGSLILHL